MTSTKGTRYRITRVLKKAGAVLIPLLFFSYLFSLTLNLSLNDPDLFWHIKTGEYIVTNWEVPDVDPFAYTTPRPLNKTQRIGLRSQWLGQVFFYLAYMAGNLKGVFVFRNLLLAFPSVLLYVWLIRNGAGLLSALTVTSLPALFFSMQLFYPFERPQGISFSLVLVLVILLDRLRERSMREGRDFTFWLIPLIMAFWSNIHAGFIVGNIIIFLYCASEALWALYHRVRKAGAPHVRPVFFIVCAAAMAATVLNPNTYNLFYSYTTGMLSMFVTNTTRAFSGQSGSWVRDVVLEYKPLYYFYVNLNYKWIVYYWAFTVLLYLSIFIKYWFRKKVDLAELLSLSFLVFFANYHARGLMFSLTVMPYYMAKTLTEIRLPEVKYRVMYKGVLASILLLSIGFCTYTYKLSPFLFKPAVTKTMITPWYPTRLVKFLKANWIDPPMYNYYTWGGFLIWSLYPDYQVFIDGRALDSMVNRTADDILKLQGSWEAKLDAYGINFIVVPVIFRESGHIIPLGPALVKNDKWKLIFIKNNSAIFVRDVPKNRELIYKYNIDKQHVFIEIIEIENILLSAMPNNHIYNIAKADALYALGKYKESKAILERFPGKAVFRLRKLKKMGY
jgi:hypothetical protein